MCGRRLLIASALYAIGLVVYLLQSGAPERVRAVVAVGWLAILMAASIVAWIMAGRLRRRALAMVVVIIISAMVFPVLLDTVRVRPDVHPTTLRVRWASLLSVVIPCFLLTTWLIEYLWRRVKPGGKDAT